MSSSSTLTTTAPASKPGWWKKRLRSRAYGKGRYWYHSTATENVSSILKEGLQPDLSSRYQGDRKQTRAGHVYLGTWDVARMLAGTHQDFVILAIDLTQLDPTRLRGDEDAFDNRRKDWQKFGLTAPPDYEPQYGGTWQPGDTTLGEWAEANGLASEAEVRHSMDIRCSVAYLGSIPAQAINVAEKPLT